MELQRILKCIVVTTLGLSLFAFCTALYVRHKGEAEKFDQQSKLNAMLVLKTEVEELTRKAKKSKHTVVSLNKQITNNELEIKILNQAIHELENKRTTLDKVKERGYMICGVGGEIKGFSYTEKIKNYTYDAEGKKTELYTNSEGLEADLCRVVAVAIFGHLDNSLFFKDVSLVDRFVVLKNKQVDIVFRNSTWTSERDTKSNEYGVDFGPVYFHDGQKFMVRKNSISNNPKLMDLKDMEICVLDGTTTIKNLKVILQQLNIEVTDTTLVTNHRNGYAYKTNEGIRNAFYRSECDALTGDESTLIGNMSHHDKERYRIFPDEPISYEPLAPMVAENDNKWRELISYAILSTMWAEQNGFSSKTIAGSFANETWKSFDLDPRNSEAIIRLVGNYQEIYNRNLGGRIPRRGRNNLSTFTGDERGWMVVPPLSGPIIPISRSYSINYKSNSDTPTSESIDEITTYLDGLLNDWRIISISILGHTDTTGKSEYNQVLSQRRAEGVRLELMQEFRDIPIDAVGLGETQPVDLTNTTEGHQKNRRVEIVTRVIDVDG